VQVVANTNDDRMARPLECETGKATVAEKEGTAVLGEFVVAATGTVCLSLTQLSGRLE
jgi:hypothetical protein